jgi:hypothetical protein
MAFPLAGEIARLSKVRDRIASAIGRALRAGLGELTWTPPAWSTRAKAQISGIEFLPS